MCYVKKVSDLLFFIPWILKARRKIVKIADFFEMT